jgi:protein CpxP
MKDHRTKIIIAAVAIVLLGAVAVSQTVKRTHWGGPGMIGGGLGLEFYSHQLDLTDAQRTQMKDILTKEKPTVHPLYLQLEQAHHQMRQLTENGTFDEAQVRAVATQQSQVMTELAVQQARIQSELIQVLTADQKAKLKDIMDRHKQRFADHLQKQTTGSPEKQ